ncbi:TerC family protein [Cellulomonas sp. P24]|uniref:TerC family protein n=1 Tax=Cellulomonas sp. P24 TaxID=2885206 RepID=UPI00216AD5CF|nr:TerC family protein [Cellulomonas sp. P24]MCR6494742.1 TerC family protein [Cellulomonas sp. P24]
MSVPLWIWVATVVGIAALLVFDFYTHVRTPHAPSFRESASWSAVYVGLALVFGVGLGIVWGWGHGAEYFAGYVMEKSLSVDNLFVFLIIMTRFAVPREYQQKVLLVGVAIALVLRGVFIFLGAAAIAQFSWVFYLFGAFLLYTAVTLAREDHDQERPADYKDPALVRLMRRLLPTTNEYHGDRLTIALHGRRLLTPMLIVMVAIGSTDVLFALDSIPAVYGLTKEPYIVFATNALALLGLRQLYFLLGGLLQRLVFLSEGLAVILGFIGIKLVLEALHTNEVPFINGGAAVAWAPEIPIWLSMIVILGTLTVATVASVITTGRRARQVGRTAEVRSTDPAVTDTSRR